MRIMLYYAVEEGLNKINIEGDLQIVISIFLNPWISLDWELYSSLSEVGWLLNFISICIFLEN
jgi:hypothetical protein